MAISRCLPFLPATILWIDEWMDIYFTTKIEKDSESGYKYGSLHLEPSAEWLL
jgi:hypothetical protein